MSAQTNAGQHSGLSIIAGQNVTPVLQIVTWLLQCISVLAILVKLGIKIKVIRDFTKDDIAILITLVLSTGQCIAASLQNGYGFGQRSDALTATQLTAALKSQYAAQLLLILSLCGAKLSVAAFVRQLTPNKPDRRIILAFEAVIVIWTFCSFVVVAFECHVPQTWNWLEGQCINRTDFWTAYGILNILTDATLIIIPVRIVINLQTSLRRRLVICFSFSLRLFVIAATIAQIYYYHHLSSPSSDPTYSPWLILLTTQILLSASIITACVPQFKRLLDLLNSGMLGNDDLRRRGQTGLYGYHGYYYNKGGKSQEEGYLSKPKEVYGLRKKHQRLAGVMESSISKGSCAEEEEDGGMKMELTVRGRLESRMEEGGETFGGEGGSQGSRSPMVSSRREEDAAGAYNTDVIQGYDRVDFRASTHAQ